MAIPDYQGIMKPLLALAGDGLEHTISESCDRLASQFDLNTVERREMLNSGTQRKFDNRVGWARTYLTKAGLLEKTGKGSFRITKRGSSVLKSGVNVDNKLLLNYPEFQIFYANRDRKALKKSNVTEQTPEEILEASHQKLRNELAGELLERVSTCSPRFFENLVVDLLVAMGYGGSRRDAGEAIGRSRDGGIDGIIKEDKLGLDVVYVQAKRWQNTVGRPEVQAFAGSLEGRRARKGVLMTTSQFSPDALDYVERIEKRIILIDGSQLSNLMIEHGIGVTRLATYTICKVDSDYFAEE